MKKSYKTPGFYIDEDQTFPPSVAQVETAIPAFIGYTEKAKKNVEGDLLMIPTRINSLTEYENLFGYPESEKTIVVNIIDKTDSSGSLKTRDLIANYPSSPSKYLLYYDLQMYFDNGGGPCYIVSVGNYSTGIISIKELDASSGGLAALEKADEPTLILFPDSTGLENEDDFYSLFQQALEQCGRLRDRFVIVDLYSDNDTSVSAMRSKLSSNYLSYGAAYYPFLKTTINFRYDDQDVTITHKKDGNCSFLNGKKVSEIKDSEYDLYNQIKEKISSIGVILPPGGAIAGIYAKTDSERGVWKAPANVSLNSVIAPTVSLTDKEQEVLNVDTVTGKSVNAIRTFTGKGTLVWGARTLAGNDNEWRYIPVRRFFNMVEESCKKAVSFCVYEQNDSETWIRVKAILENFLLIQWRRGALAGAKSEHAFFVKCGSGTTMSAQDILEGRLNVEIGMAAIRPAEFIILRFSIIMARS